MNTEVITAAQANDADLRRHAETINETIDLIVQHEDAFKEAVLEPALLIGREITKAQAVFGLTKAEAGAIGGSMPRGVACLPPPAIYPGFSVWLAREIPRLARSTAQKYATCFKALNLPVEAPDAKVRAALKDLAYKADKAGEPRPSLNSLYKAARPPKNTPFLIAEPGTENGKSAAQARLEDAREFWGTWREQGEKLIRIGSLDHLDKKGLEEMKEFQGWLRDRINARLKTL